MKCGALAVLGVLALAPSAQAAPRGHYIPLPSPLAPLSQAPPLSGGATATTERYRHRVDARTTVDVSLDPQGAPFAVRATQRLDVRLLGDYFFTIGAPVLDVQAGPGSASTPGLRSASILWAGFNPGRRILSARATLHPAASASALPLRVEVTAGRVTLVNATAVTAGSFAGDALVPPLLDYLAHLRRQVALGRLPLSGGAYVTAKPVTSSERIVAPLRVTGTAGGRKVDAVLEGRLTIDGRGPLRLTVTPEAPHRLLDAPAAGLSGRQLLARVTRVALTLARVRQYQMFLGNPDPTGKNETTYLYRTAARPAPPPVTVVPTAHRDWTTTIAVAAGLLLAAIAALLTWSRS